MTEKRSKYGLLGRLNFEDLYNAFLGLEERQQALIALGGVLVLILLFILPISCASSRLSRLEREYDKSSEEIAQLSNKFRDYQASRSKLEAIKKRLEKGENESLTTVLENIANEEGIGANIEKLRPINLESTDYYDETGVDGTISKISLDQAVSFLTRLENESRLALRIKKLQIKPSYQNRSVVNINLQVSTIKLKGGAGE